MGPLIIRQLCLESIALQACLLTSLVPAAGWEWVGPWEAEDWAYGPDWGSMRYPPTTDAKTRSLVDFVRRRRWVRRRRRAQQMSPGASGSRNLIVALPAAQVEVVPCKQ